MLIENQCFSVFQSSAKLNLNRLKLHQSFSTIHTLIFNSSINHHSFIDSSISSLINSSINCQLCQHKQHSISQFHLVSLLSISLLKLPSILLLNCLNHLHHLNCLHCLHHALNLC